MSSNSSKAHFQLGCLIGVQASSDGSMDAMTILYPVLLSAANVYSI
jgi:hypothetical protein